MVKRMPTTVASLHLSPRMGFLERTCLRRWILPSIQVRTRVTQQQLPSQPKKKLKRSQSRKLQEELAKPLSKRIKWKEVDLSAVKLPEPRMPEPQLHFENGRTFYKHPLRYAIPSFHILELLRLDTD